MNNQAGLGDMRPRQILPRQPRSPSQPEAALTVSICTDKLRTLFRVRYFLLGVLIGTVIWVPIFLIME